MRLSTKTRYGVRAIFDIAYNNSGEPALAKDIARREAIPLRYLEQIFQDLRRAGIVESKRGPKGGYYLKNPADEITLGAVVEALQGSVEEMLAVQDEANNMSATGPGHASMKVTGGIWRDLAAEIRAWFEGITIQDLVERAAELGLPRDQAAEPMYYI